MKLDAKRPELEGYADAVKAAKADGLGPDPSAPWFMIAGLGFFYAAGWLVEQPGWNWFGGILFAFGILAWLCSALLFLHIIDPPGVAKRLRLAKTLLAEQMGWHWSATETDKAGEPVTPGRLSGEVAGLPFVMETDRKTRTIRLTLPERADDLGDARDFYDLAELEDERKRRNSLDAFPRVQALIAGESLGDLGRNLRLERDGMVLILRAESYQEKGLGSDANILRRMREAEAILSFCETVRADWGPGDAGDGMSTENPASQPRIATPR